jgi:hypothetical protein
MPRLNQNLSDVDPNDANGGGWSAFPDGDYTCEVDASEYKRTAAGDGMVLKLKIAMLDDGLRGKFFYDNITLEHPNSDTVRIARAQLKQLAIAVRHPNPNMVEDSVELHGIPMIVELVRQRAKSAKFGDSEGFENRVKGYRMIGTPASAPPQRPATAPAPKDNLPF